MPVTGSSTGTGAPTETGVAGVVTVPMMAAGTTGVPFKVSFAKAFTRDGLPVVPFTFGGVSAVAAIRAALTGI